MSSLVALVCLAGLLMLLLYLSGVRRRRPGEHPLVRGWIPYFGKTFEFSRDGQSFLKRLQEQHGDIFTVLIAGRYLTFVMDPHVYPVIERHGKHLNFQAFAMQVSAACFGHPRSDHPTLGVPTEEITNSYRFMQGSELQSMIESTTKHLHRVIIRSVQDAKDAISGVRNCNGTNGWKTGSLNEFCLATTFEAVWVTLFGSTNVDWLDHEFSTKLLEHFVPYDKAVPLLAANVPISLLRSSRHHRAQLATLLTPPCLSRLKDCSSVVAARTEVINSNGNLNDHQKAAYQLHFLWGSMSNTLQSIFWSIYHLLLHPDAQRAVKAEVTAFLEETGQSPRLGSPLRLGCHQLDSMVALGSAVTESLRLTASTLTIRVAQKDIAMPLPNHGTLRLRQGDWLTLPPYTSLHLNPDVFQEPQTYKYDRFMEGGKPRKTFYKDGRPLRHALMPFGFGATKCPGRFFALLVDKVFLALLLSHVEMELCPGQVPVEADVSRGPFGVLPPKNDVQFRYRLRPGLAE
ncbi:cytochrome P450 7B1-like [Lethenteron reissneri]|uniref:cytochrome P450 7B1-like n=1 Tax=Lethenteron reissneri TaxID=7753 RepID=UPI002AB6CC47|nr:cytochrome P450 7B1-like [Lethenteron reissneri]